MAILSAVVCLSALGLGSAYVAAPASGMQMQNVVLPDMRSYLPFGSDAGGDLKELDDIERESKDPIESSPGEDVPFDSDASRDFEDLSDVELESKNPIETSSSEYLPLGSEASGDFEDQVDLERESNDDIVSSSNEYVHDSDEESLSLSAGPTHQEEEQIGLFADMRSMFHPVLDGRFENRIGFEFASMVLHEYVHNSGDEEPSLPGTHDRIRKFARILLQHPGAHAHIDAHCGTSAPPWIAQSFSEERARVVAFELAALGVPLDRITTAGWGMTITRAALTSDHSNSASAKSGYGWAEVFIIFKSASGKDIVMPPRPDYYAGLDPKPRKVFVATPSASVAKLVPSTPSKSIAVPFKSPTYPVFYMRPGAAVGAEVALHLFEPRYRVLARRAWNGDKRFIYCAAVPFSFASENAFFNLPLESELPKDKCTMVKIDRAFFYDDERADIWGHGEQAVKLGSVYVEDGTGGLFVASISTEGVEHVQAETSHMIDTSGSTIYTSVLQSFKDFLEWMFPNVDIEFRSMWQAMSSRISKQSTTIIPGPVETGGSTADAASNLQRLKVTSKHTGETSIDRTALKPSPLDLLPLCILMALLGSLMLYAVTVAVARVIKCAKSTRKSTAAPLFLQVDPDPSTHNETFSNKDVSAPGPLLEV